MILFSGLLVIWQSEATGNFRQTGMLSKGSEELVLGQWYQVVHGVTSLNAKQRLYTEKSKFRVLDIKRKVEKT